MAEQRNDIHTRDGVRLDAEVSMPDNPTWGAVVTHPHPQYGGSMHTPVVEALFRGLTHHGAATLRFNFRGVGTSQGEFGGGDLERLDLLAAVEDMSERLGRETRGVVLVGYSFGGDICLSLDHLSIAGWWTLAPPLMVDNPEGFLAADDTRPKKLVVPEHDEFNPPAEVAVRVQDWQNVETRTLPGVGHMIEGMVEAAVADAADFAFRLRQ